MALVHIKSSHLSKDQKKRIGDRVISAFHGEGYPPGSVVVLFEREEADIYLDGGLLFEAGVATAVAPGFSLAPPAPVVVATTPVIRDTNPDFRTKLRRSKGELTDLKTQLTQTLQAEGALSSFQAQEALGLKTCDWAPATLRRFFSELEDEGVITKQGQKRGTRYVWKGLTSLAPVVPVAKLVKKTEDEPSQVGV
jgi:hypothetical protein